MTIAEKNKLVHPCYKTQEPVKLFSKTAVQEHKKERKGTTEGKKKRKGKKEERKKGLREIKVKQMLYC